MSTEPILLPCPKCGAAASLYEEPMIEGVMYWPECDRGCFRGKLFDTPQEAADWWNERCPPPTPAAIVRVGAWDGLLTRRLVLFASKEAASEFYTKSDDVYDIFISPDTEIVWHPAGREGTADG